MHERLTAFFLLIVLCLTSCAPEGAQESNSQSTEAATAEIELIQFGNDKVIDAFVEESNVVLLLQGKKSAVRVTLDAELNKVEERKLPMPSAYGMCWDGTSTYYAAPDGILKEDAYYCPNPFLSFRPDKMVFYDGALFACADQILYINGVEIAVPIAGEERYSVSELMLLEDRLYAVLTAWSDRIGGIVKQWLCPLDASLRELRIQAATMLACESSVEQTCSYKEKAYFLSGTELSCYDGEKISYICDLSPQGVNAESIRRILMLSEGTLLVVEEDGILLASIRETEKPVLQLAVYHAADYEKTVAAFNRSGAAYAVSAKEYSSVEKLNLAILNGEVDLICSPDEAVMRNFSEKMLLLPYDNAIVSRVLPNVVSAIAKQNVCRYLPLTVTCAVSTVTEQVAENVNLDSLSGILRMANEKCSASFGFLTKDVALSQTLSMYRDAWLDWQTRTAGFDSESFVEMLEFCNQYAATAQELFLGNEVAEESGKLNINIPQLNIDDYLARQQADSELGTAAERFFLLPLGAGGKCRLRTSAFYAAVSGGREEGAKIFLSFLFADSTAPEDVLAYLEPQMRSEFSAIQARCQRELDEQEAQMLGGYTSFPQEAVAEAKEAFYAMLLSAEGFSRGTMDEVDIIIKEEAAAYFNDDCTAREAAERIQERVSIYLAENS